MTPNLQEKLLKSPRFLDLPSNFSKIQFLLTNFSLHSDSTQTFAGMAFVYPCFLQRNRETRNKELIWERKQEYTPNTTLLNAKNAQERAGEMARWVRGLAALLEDLGSIPSSSQPSVNPVLRDLMPPSGLNGNWMYMVHSDTCPQNIHTYKSSK